MVKEIELTQGKVAIVDDADYEYLSQYKWCAMKNYLTWYAEGYVHNEDGKRVHQTMHRVLLKPPSGMVTDHIDGNGLNNTRNNLRLCTQSENNRNARMKRTNTSGYRGVSWHKATCKWRVDIKFNGKKIWLGLCSSPEEAALLYDKAAIDLHGEYATLNFPQRGGA